ncbi:MAG: hypothetical protein RJQ09_13770 [Cyclobacteriaceae bacterium]
MITIYKKNPLRKAEIPVLGIFFMYLFLFYTMAAGDFRLMFSKIFSFDSAIIGLTFGILGFVLTVLLGMLRVNRITLTKEQFIASTRLGFKKKYPLSDLEKCYIKWYPMKDRDYPLFQFNFNGDKKLHVVGHQFKNLKPLILHLRHEMTDKLEEYKKTV